MANVPSYATVADMTGTCAAPSGLADGDVLVAIVHHVGVIDTTGWTEIVDTSAGGVNYSALVRTVTGTPPASYTIGVIGDPGSNIVIGVALLRVTGSSGLVDGTPEIGAGSGGAGLPQVFGSIDTTSNNGLVIGFGPQGAGTPGYQSPFTDLISYNDLIATGNIIVYGSLGAAGATGALTMTTTNAYTGGFAFAISGDPPPPPPVPLPDNSATYRAPTSVLISDPAGFNQQRVPVNAVPRSWVVGGSGALSAELLSRDLVRFGLHDELRGHEIVVHDDDAGTWGGIITDAQPNGDGTTEIAATSWEASFDKKRLPRRSRALFGPAGSLALNAITESTRETGTAIVDRTATDFGIPVTLNYDGGDLLAALDSMADETGQEWWIDSDTRAFRWGVKGRDLTGSVHLIAGRHIVDWRMPTSLEPVINDLLAFPTNDDYAVWQAVRVTNPASIAAVGIRQGSAAIPGGTHAVHIRGRAQGLVNELAALGQAIEFDLANVDRCFRWFREGDQICITVPSISVQVTCRVMARSINDDGTMSVSADVLTRRDV